MQRCQLSGIEAVVVRTPEIPDLCSVDGVAVSHCRIRWLYTYAKCYICAPYANRLLHKVHAQCLYVILAKTGRRCQWQVAQDCLRTYSKLPSTYLTINDVFPICESPTIPTFSTTLVSKEAHKLAGSCERPECDSRFICRLLRRMVRLHFLLCICMFSLFADAASAGFSLPRVRR